MYHLFQACQSFKNVTHGFITRDEASLKVYLTTQHPYDDVFEKIVRQTCFQSISCEVNKLFIAFCIHSYITLIICVCVVSNK